MNYKIYEYLNNWNTYTIVLILIVFPILVYCFLRKKHKANVTNNKNNMGAIVIICSTVLGVLSIIAVVIYQLFVSKTNTNISVADKIIDMQSITLAITGISISLISIISTVLTVQRERSYDRIEDNIRNQFDILNDSLKEEIQKIENEKKVLDSYIKELEEKQKALIETSDSQNSLMLIDSMFLDKRKKRLLFELSTSAESFYMQYFYIRTLHKSSKGNADEVVKTQWYNSIIENGKDIIKQFNNKSLTNNVTKTQKYLTLLMIADAYSFLSESDIVNASRKPKEDIIKNLKEAKKYYRLADELYSDEDGYVLNSYGLLCFWKYKYFYAIDQGKDNIQLLDESIDYYQKAIHENGSVAAYHNNLGVSYLQKAKVASEEFQDDILNKAENSFKAALRLESYDSKATINMGDVIITKIRIMLDLKQEIVIFQSKKAHIGQMETSNDEIELLVKKAKLYFNNAILYEPYFVNGYYKKAQLYVYHLFFLLCTSEGKSKEVEILKKDILQLFEECVKINANTKGAYYIKRMYFDAIGDLDEATRINQQISAFNKNNAEKWSRAYEEYKHSITPGVNSIS